MLLAIARQLYPDAFPEIEKLSRLQAIRSFSFFALTRASPPKNPCPASVYTRIIQWMILLVEDEAISRYAIAQILRSHEQEVMEAKDGIEAQALLDEYPFDLIITDLVMPGLDSFGLVFRVVRNGPPCR
jgi:PleD family two-component response regulator